MKKCWLTAPDRQISINSQSWGPKWSKDRPKEIQRFGARKKFNKNGNKAWRSAALLTPWTLTLCHSVHLSWDVGKAGGASSLQTERLSHSRMADSVFPFGTVVSKFYLDFTWKRRNLHLSLLLTATFSFPYRPLRIWKRFGPFHFTSLSLRCSQLVFLRFQVFLQLLGMPLEFSVWSAPRSFLRSSILCLVPAFLGRRPDAFQDLSPCVVHLKPR